MGIVDIIYYGTNMMRVEVFGKMLVEGDIDAVWVCGYLFLILVFVGVLHWISVFYPGGYGD